MTQGFATLKRRRPLRSSLSSYLVHFVPGGRRSSLAITAYLRQADVVKECPHQLKRTGSFFEVGSTMF